VAVTGLQMPLLGAVSPGHLDITLLVFGALLVVAALVSGVAKRSFLSLTAVFVLVGFALGRGGFMVLHFHALSSFTNALAIVALIVILFRDGLEVDAELLQTHWRLPLRKLVLAMPLTLGIIALGAKLLTNLSWSECFLLGALLSPTDPVLSSTVVTNPRVPPAVRHSLNLESGLNDGLALPAVLAFAALLTPGGGHFVWWRFVLEDLAIGFATGLVVGLVAARLMPHEEGLGPEIPRHQKALYALGTAFVAYGIAVLPPHGNGLIAVYVTAIVLGIRRPDLRAHFARQSEDLVEIVKLGIFVVFGSVLTVHGLFGDGWAAVGIVAITLLLARPVAVFAALAGTETDTATRAFMSWFGPKGVATMTFALLVLSDQINSGVRIFNLAALAVFCSILAHGLSDTPGAEWLARRAEELQRRKDEAVATGAAPLAAQRTRASIRAAPPRSESQ
jgi:NhaP-type Na+/H+ or K+/H+ antiporter